MYKKKINEPIADSHKEQDADHDMQSHGYGEAEPISKLEVRLDSRVEVEPTFADSMWIEARKRVDMAAAQQNAKSGRKPVDDGAAGAAGAVGPQGLAGAKGDKGNAGSAGAKGDAGVAGTAGAKGDAGAVGPQGLAGPKGDKGDAGSKGDTGAAGADGAKSYRSFGSESARSTGEQDSTKFPDDTFEVARAAVPEAVAHSDETDLLDIVRRQWRLIGVIVGVTTIMGAVVLSQLTPMYTANAEVIIEPQRPTLPALETILPGIGTDEQSIVTEVALLTSGILLDSLIDRLDLVSDPEFNSILDSPEAVTGVELLDSLIDRLDLVSDPKFNSILDSLAAVTGADKAREQSPLQVPADRMRALTSLLSRLDVAQVGASRVITVTVASESGDKAAMIANTLVDEYFQSRRESKFQASSETSSWLEERIANLLAELRESEQRAERFRSDAELIEAGGATLISQQLVNLSGQVISARAETASAQAELSQVGELIRSADSSSILASAGVLQSPLVQELRKQQVALEREIAELSSELGPVHPRMLQLRADAADLESQISIEVDKVVQGLRNSVKVAEAREAGLEREAVLLTAGLSQTKRDEIQLRALEREAEANRQLLETLLARRKVLGSPDLMQTGQSDARVISFAKPPITPSFPKFGISIAGIFMVSMIIGFVVASILEIRRLGISTLEQLEAVSKLRALGFVPHVASRQQQRGMLLSVLTKSRRPFAQAMKTLNWQMDQGMPESAKVIVVTSPIAGEGKTTTAIAIARIKALKGHKTIIVDADIRKPTVHTRLKCQQTSGLTDVIEGRSKLVDVILPDEESPLEILPAGQASSDALDLVESLAMSSVLEELSSQYDYIIVDSPPIAAGPDACILSKDADTTILTVRCLTTPANAVRYALRVLKRNGGHITGTVLTMVEASGYLNRKYGYFGYYGNYGAKA